MILCKELDKSFETEELLFEALRGSQKEIIGIKKAQILKSYEKDSNTTVTVKPLDASKLSSVVKDIDFDDDHYYIAVNSTRILDSHRDLHLDKIWNKSVKDLQGQNYLVDTHVLSMNTTIVRKEYIEMFTAVVPFSMIGKKYDGDTEILIYKFLKDKIVNPTAKEWLQSGDAIQASVRMRYTDIVLAMNSQAKEDKEELKNYNKYIDIIANKDDFEDDIYYFWAVKQAQNLQESSLVLFGSNHVTGTIQETKNTEQSDDTQKQEEAAKALQEAFIINVLNN